MIKKDTISLRLIKVGTRLVQVENIMKNSNTLVLATELKKAFPIQKSNKIPLPEYHVIINEDFISGRNGNVSRKQGYDALMQRINLKSFQIADLSMHTFLISFKIRSGIRKNEIPKKN